MRLFNVKKVLRLKKYSSFLNIRAHFLQNKLFTFVRKNVIKAKGDVFTSTWLRKSNKELENKSKNSHLKVTFLAPLRCGCTGEEYNKRVSSKSKLFEHFDDILCLSIDD